MDALLSIARDAAARASARTRAHYGTTDFTLKDDHSPVTIADTDAHDTIMMVLGDTGITVLSEESDGIPSPYPDRLWIIDPLDGTKGFLKRTGDFATMIALLEHGRPVLAVVDAPVLGKQYFALRGRGAFVATGTAITTLRVSDRTIPNLRSVMSVNHSAPYMELAATRLMVRESIAIGSVGIKAGYIGEDRGDYYLTRGMLGEWDVCAPELIVTEAGGTVTDTTGCPLTYGNEGHRIQNGVVFSNSVCHDAVLEALQQIP